MICKINSKLNASVDNVNNTMQDIQEPEIGSTPQQLETDSDLHISDLDSISGQTNQNPVELKVNAKTNGTFKNITIPLEDFTDINDQYFNFPKCFQTYRYPYEYKPNSLDKLITKVEKFIVKINDP